MHFHTVADHHPMLHGGSLGLSPSYCKSRTHQWIYQCVLVHDCTTGTIISAHKEELLKEVKHQLNIGVDGLNKQDQFLLECNFDELATTAGEHQESWLLAIQAARKALRVCTGQADKDQQCTVGTGQRWAFI
jgi:hypothetical protein